MNRLEVDPELLEAILGASYSTYMAHRDCDKELYALGCLEATANLVYILTSGTENEELATTAQLFAGVAIDRSLELLPSHSVHPTEVRTKIS